MGNHEIFGRRNWWTGRPGEKNWDDWKSVEQVTAGDNEGKRDQWEIDVGVPWPFGDVICEQDVVPEEEISECDVLE